MRGIVSDIVSCGNQIHQFFLNQKISNLLKRSNIGKEKGISQVSGFCSPWSLPERTCTAPSKQVEARAWPRTQRTGFATQSIFLGRF
jgi:hypothetical protein